VPEAQRWRAWERLVADDARAEKGRGGPAYGIVRSRQKHDGGRLVAERLGRPAAWFVEADDALDERIAKAAYNG
jgi:hypothetical protein